MSFSREKTVEQTIKVKIPKKKVLKAYRPYLMDFQTERMVFYGGAGSGKSYFVALKVIVTLLQSKRKALICRKYGTTIEDSIYADILNQLEMLGILKYCKVNKSTKKIRLPNGSMIIMKPLDDEHKIKSINGISLIWVEEATDIDKEIYNQLENRLRGQKDLLPGQEQQLIITFNPVSKANWCYLEFFDEGTPEKRGNGWRIRNDEELKKRYKVIHTNYMDNPTLPQSFLNTILGYKENNPFKYEVYALGKFASLGKLVFPKFTVADLDEWELRRNHDLVPLNGIDYGHVDPTAIVYTYADFENKKIYIYKEVYELDCKASDMYRLIQMSGGLRETFYADNARPEITADLYDLGIDVHSCKKGHGSIMQGIMYLNDFEIIVDKSCVHMIEEFENYSYKKDKTTGQYTDEPLDEGFNHLCDALRYAYSYRQTEVKPVYRPHIKQ